MKIKRKISAALLFLFAFALLPMLAARTFGNSAASVPVVSMNTVDEPLPAEGRESVINAAAALAGDSFCDEALKACLILAGTNIRAGKSVEESKSNNNSDREICERLSGIYDSDSTARSYLTFDGKCLYIPSSPCSGGSTAGSKDYPYLSAVASPWDCFSGEDAEGECIGVSLYGIDSLCQSGKSAEQALLWYLPGSKINN